jgi:hypothetical protein
MVNNEQVMINVAYFLLPTSGFMKGVQNGAKKAISGRLSLLWKSVHKRRLDQTPEKLFRAAKSHRSGNRYKETARQTAALPSTGSGFLVVRFLATFRNGRQSLFTGFG